MSKDKREGWLADIKVGDVITWSNLWRKRGPCKVSKITPTGQISCLLDTDGAYKDYARFNHKGQEIGAVLERMSIDKPKVVTDAE